MLNEMTFRKSEFFTFILTIQNFSLKLHYLSVKENKKQHTLQRIFLKGKYTIGYELNVLKVCGRFPINLCLVYYCFLNVSCTVCMAFTECMDDQMRYCQKIEKCRPFSDIFRRYLSLFFLILKFNFLQKASKRKQNVPISFICDVAYVSVM